MAVLTLDARHFGKPEVPIKRNILEQPRVHEESEFGEATSTGFCFGKGHQPSTMALPLYRWGNRDIRYQQRPGAVLQQNDSEEVTVLLKHPDLAVGDALGVIVLHRTRFTPKARNPGRVRRTNERANCASVIPKRRTDDRHHLVCSLDIKHGVILGQRYEPMVGETVVQERSDCVAEEIIIAAEGR